MAEIPALMFHGYTMIDHCLRVYKREPLPGSHRRKTWETPISDDPRVSAKIGVPQRGA